MLAKDLLSEVVPALRTSDTGLRALSWMEIFRISHLPIVNDQEFLGLISDTDIYDLNMAEEPIGNHKLSLFSPFVVYNQHIYDVMKLVAENRLTVVAVLNEKKEYLGLITLSELLYHFAELSALKDPGGLIVLELNQNDYSLTHIAQIVEGNDAKILSAYVTSPDQSTELEVTLKINRTDLTPIVQTFNRYNYNIKASYMEDQNMDSFYSNRYDSFMRYLNI